MTKICNNFSLGIDLGIASQGIAIVWEQDKPKLLVRCFDTVTGSIQELEEGKEKTDESKNAIRRSKRLARRQYERRSRRKSKLFHQLQHIGLLPKGKSQTSKQRHQIINKLDKDLLASFLSQKQYDQAERHRIANLLPYLLRAKALEVELQPFELGRIFYQMVQRRGFKSNRRERAKDIDELGESKNEEKGKINPAISALNSQLNGKTLGQYLSTLNPDKQNIHVRQTTENTYLYYPSRQMYIDEFNAIWEAQFKLNSQKPHPILTLQQRRKIYHTIFYQRPLKSQRSKIGSCELERGKRRAPVACLEFQRFRYWLRINDLRILLLNGEERELTHKEKEELAGLLETGEKYKYKDIADHFGWKKAKYEKYVFNLQKMKDSGLPINITAKQICKVYPDWNNLTESKKEELVDILLLNISTEKMIKLLVKIFGFDRETAVKLADVTLASDYASYSRKALKKLLPEIQKGTTLHQACSMFYPNYGKQLEKYKFLPPVNKVFPNLTNPSVKRSLTELRKTVNAIIRRYGQPPETIRVEISRILKRSKKVRERDHENMVKNKTDRERIVSELLEKCELKKPSNTDIIKYHLWEECGQDHLDPYSGDEITLDLLFGSNPQFDIEHIYPQSRSFDNSFANKTLCRKDYNLAKGNQIPFEAFSNDTKEWKKIIERVKKFKGPFAKEKLKRFESKEIPADFTNRMLNDNSYIAKAAVKYLGYLYGGIIDQDGSLRDKTERDPDEKQRGKLRVQVVPGQATARLRKLWGLNEKDRTNHQHHAVDALIIAYCTYGVVKQLAEESEKADKARLKGEKYRVLIKPPQENFTEIVQQAVDNINVSYRVSRKINGGFHKETNYSPSHVSKDKNGKTTEYRHIRKPLQEMSKDEIENIVDPAIRKLVEKKLKRLGSKDLKKFTEKELPYIKTKSGQILIRKARIRKNVGTITLAPTTVKERHVAPGNNHHIEIFEVLDDNGNVKEIDWCCVNLFETIQRVKAKQYAVARSNHYGDGKPTRLKFSLAKGEYVQATPPGEDTVLLRVCKISEGDMSLCLHTDARNETLRKKKEQGESQSDFQKYRITSIKKLEQFKLRKVTVDVLGNIHPAND